MFCLNTFLVYFAWKDNMKETVLESLGLVEKWKNDSFLVA